MAAGFTSDVASSQCNAFLSSSSNSAQETLSPSRQNCCSFAHAAATTSGPNDVSMNDVYMSDDDAENSMDRSANPTSLPDSTFSRKSPTAMVTSPAKPAPGYPTSVVSNVPSVVPDSAGVRPPGFLPSFQQQVPASVASSPSKSSRSYPATDVVSNVPSLVPDRTGVGPSGFPPSFQQKMPASVASSPSKSTRSYPATDVVSNAPSLVPDNSVRPPGFLPSFQQQVPASMASSPSKSSHSYPATDVVSNAPSLVPDNSVRPPGFLPSFQQQVPASMASSPSKSSHSYPASNMPSLVQSNPSVGPPIFLPPVPQELSGMAFGSGMPIPMSGGDLAQMERVLQDNPQLTEQVTALIVQHYPLYAANPVTLRFAVCRELKLLQKFREEQGRPAIRPAPCPTSSDISSTSVADPDSTSRSNSATNCQEISRSRESLGASSAASSSFAWRNSDGGTKRSAVAAASTAVPVPTTSAWTGSVPSSVLGDHRNPRRVKVPVNHSSAGPGRYVTDSLDSFGEMTTPQKGLLAVSNSYFFTFYSGKSQFCTVNLT